MRQALRGVLEPHDFERLFNNVSPAGFQNQVSEALRNYKNLRALAQLSANWTVATRAKDVPQPPRSPLEKMIDDIILFQPLESFVCRAAYIVAWAAFEDIIGDCVRLCYVREPQRLMAALSSKQSAGPSRVAGVVASRFLVDRASREEVLEELIAMEISELQLGRRINTLPHYLKRALDVTIEADWIKDLAPVRDVRNESAHDAAFTALPEDQVERELRAFQRAGGLVVGACVVQRGLPTLDAGVTP